MFFFFVFFFKQKTAYEMRISDWSSDVCSSDLRHVAASIIRACSYPAYGKAERRAASCGHNGNGASTMLIRILPPHALRESDVTPEPMYLDRRRFVAGLGIGVATLSLPLTACGANAKPAPLAALKQIGREQVRTPV